MAIFTVDIQHWKKPNGKIDGSGWKQMLEIPSRDSDGFPISNPKVKCSEDNADSFDFTVEPGSEYYDAFVQLITLLRVTYNGTVIFFGRVLTINGSTIFQTRNIHCEGAMGFLNDSYYEGKPEKDRQEIGWSEYYNKLLENHNSQTEDDAWKVITRGLIHFTPTSKVKKYEPSSWTQTLSLFNSLKDECGGHMLIRYEGGYSYLDWYQYYKRDRGRSNRPTVTIGENILDLTLNTDVGNVFTRVIPIGKTDNSGSRVYIDGYEYTDKDGNKHTHSGKAMPVGLLTQLYSSSALTNDFMDPSDYEDAEDHYGVIYKTMEFPDADTQEKLWDECKEWIYNSFYGIAPSYEIKAIDMFFINGEDYPIMLGDCVDAYFRFWENGQMVDKPPKKLVCKSVQYDLYNPDNNTYTIGIPSDFLKTTKSSQSSSTDNKKTTASQAASTPTGTDKDIDTELTFAEIAEIIRNDPDVANGYGGDAAADSFIANGTLTGTTKVNDDSIYYNPIDYPDSVFTANLVGKITVSGKDTKYIGFNSSHGLFAFKDQIYTKSETTISKVFYQLGGQNEQSVVRPITHWYIKKSGYTYDDGTQALIYEASKNIADFFIEKMCYPNDSGVTPVVSIANGMLGVGKLMSNDTSDKMAGAIAVIGAANSTLDLVDPDRKVKTFVADTANGIWNWILGKGSLSDMPSLTARLFGEDNLGAILELVNSPEWGQSHKESNIQAGIQLTSSTSSLAIFQPVYNAYNQTIEKIRTGWFGGLGGGNLNLANATGDEVIKESGTDNIISQFNKTFSGAMEKVIESNGQATNKDKDNVVNSTGKLKVGKDLRDGASTDFKVVMNDSFSYTGYRKKQGSDEYEYFDDWTDGFIKASDFKVQDIPSFRTKLAVVDKVLADQVETNKLVVNDNAWIKSLTGTTYEASTYVKAYLLACATLTADTSVTAGNFYWSSSSTATIYPGTSLQDGVHHALFKEGSYNSGSESYDKTTGKITLELYDWKGQVKSRTDFNMSATSYYKQAVADAKKTGSESTYAEFTNLSLAPGESCGVTLYSDITGTKRRTKGSTGVDYTISAKKIFGLDVYDNDDNPGDSALPRNKYITEPLDIVSRYYYEDSNGNKVWTTGGACKVTPEQKAYYHLDVYDNDSSSESPLPSSKDLKAGNSITIGAWFYYLKSDGGKDWHKGGSVKVTAKDKHSKLGTLKCTAKSEAAGHVYYTLTGSDLTKAMKVDDTIEVYY